MTRKQIAEKIKNEMPEGLTVEEKSAYIMVEIAKIKSFDEHYLWGKAGQARKIYKLASKEKTRENSNEESKRKLICVNIAKLYQYVAQEVGLQCFVISEDLEEADSDNIKVYYNEHVFNYVLNENNEKILVDVQEDLAKLQSKREPEAFGNAMSRCVHIKFKEIGKTKKEQILRKVGYLQPNEKYFDEEIDDWCKENYDKDSMKVIEKLLSDEKFNQKSKDLGCIEKFKFYKFAISEALEELQKEYKPDAKFSYLGRDIFVFPCYASKNGQRKFSFGIYCINKDFYKIYMHSVKNNKIQEIEPQTMSALMKSGLKLGISRNQQETLAICMYMKKYEKENKSKISKLDNNVDDYLFDDER